MKSTLRTTSVVFLLFGIVQFASAQKNSSQLDKEGYKRYAMVSAYIEFAIRGAQSGKEILQFDRWGLREAKREELEIKAGGMTIPSKTETIMDGEFTYALDRDKNTATKTTNQILTQITAKHETKDLTEVGERTLKAMGAKKTGTESFLGKRCDVWEVKSLGTRMLVYNGLPLKSETNMAGMKIIREATKFDENPKIADDKLTVPSTMKVIEGGSPLEMLRQLKKKKN
jgi:hypothetical protein